MSVHTPNIDADRLRQLSQEVSRIASSLAQLTEAAPTDSRSKVRLRVDTPQITEEAVTWLINARRHRTRFLPQELFAEPAWDILLDLLRAEIVQERISVSSLCIAAGVPTTTALRYIKSMAEQGVIVRRSDPFDGRRVFVELSPNVSAALRRYFADIVQSGAPKS